MPAASTTCCSSVTATRCEGLSIEQSFHQLVLWVKGRSCIDVRGAVLALPLLHSSPRTHAQPNNSNSCSWLPSSGVPLLKQMSLHRAVTRYQAGDYVGAVRQCTELAWLSRTTPKLIQALEWRASSLDSLERLLEALADCNRILMLDPGYATVYHTRAYLCNKCGRHQEVCRCPHSSRCCESLAWYSPLADLCARHWKCTNKRCVVERRMPHGSTTRIHAHLHARSQE